MVDAERTASVSRDSDGQLLGVMLYLNGEEIQTLGVSQDASKVRYRIENGNLHVEPAGDAE